MGNLLLIAEKTMMVKRTKVIKLKYSAKKPYFNAIFNAKTLASIKKSIKEKNFPCGNLASVLKALRKASVIYNTCNKEKK